MAAIGCSGRKPLVCKPMPARKAPRLGYAYATSEGRCQGYGSRPERGIRFERARKIGGHFIKLNVTDETSVEAAIEEAEALNGKARILVNWAGIGPPAKVIGRDGKAVRSSIFRRP